MPDVDARVRPILNEALDEALRVYMAHQFHNWLLQSAAKGKPLEYAAAGVRKAVAAYQNAHSLRDGAPASVEHVQKILREGLDREMREYIAKIFRVFLSEGGVVVSKHVIDARHFAIAAYLGVLDAIDKMGAAK